MKETLTDRRLKSLRPEPAQKPFEIMDSVVPGFGVRIMGKPDAPVRSFILLRRFPGSSNPVRRTLGSYGELTLDQARQKARQWLELITKGIDPAREEERLRKAAIEAERSKEATTFAAVFEAYLKHKRKLRSIQTIEREVRRECAAWMDKPLADISSQEVKRLIGGIAGSGRESSAHAIFAYIRGFTNWAADAEYIENPICARLKPKVLIGEKKFRSRVLKDYEIGAYWRASEALGYPFGPFLKLLVLTALRRNEASEARWSEIDFGAKLWTIPAERMKAGAAHTVPLTADVLALLEGLPRFHGGDYLFSTRDGRRPISGFSKTKAKLDALMKADLEAQGKPFEDFVLHDIRRTCRTRFSALPIEDIVRELLVAHARPGLHKIYDLHAYEAEKRRGLELWHAKLKAIVAPRPADNVAQFPLARAK